MPETSLASPSFQGAYNAAAQPTPSSLQPTGQGNSVAPVATQPTATPAVPLDPTIVNLAKAIRTQETGAQGNFTAVGGSGEYGAYQFTQPTWNAVAPLAGVTSQYNQSTPQEQNAVAYAYISQLKNQGYNVGQIASIWNSGKPDPTGNVGTNASGVAYNTPQYVQNVYNNYTALKNTAPQTQSTTEQPAQGASLGGFLGNVAGSAGNLLANIGNAVVHPIQTVENLGSIGVGALQEAGGEQNSNTQAFENVKNYFKNRYGSIGGIENTLYTDPVGFLADLSTVLTGVGGVAGIAAEGADLASLGDVARVASDVAPAVEGSGLAGGLQTAGEALSTAATKVNPLTPVVSGAIKLGTASSGLFNEALGQLIGQSGDVVQNVRANPELYTPEAMAGASRIGLAQEIQTTLQGKISDLEDTGSGYSTYREAPTPIETAPDFLDNAFREAGVNVEDGVVSANSESTVRASADISKLQQVYNLYKPDFLNGTMDSNKFLNLRSDLSDMAYNDTGIKNTRLASAGEKIRSTLNETYRPQVEGLTEKDESYSSQIQDLKRLRKGFVDKNGELLSTATNKIANAGGKGKDLDLARLEELMPGITLRLQTLKTIEAIQNSGIKVGAYTRSIMQAGRLGATIFGAATGNIKILAGALAMDFISRPETALDIMKAVAKVRPEVVEPILANMAKYAVSGAVATGALSGGQTNTPTQTPPSTASPQTTDQTTPPQSPPSAQDTQSSSNDITQTPGYQAAIAAGYSPQEIEQYLASQTSQ